MHSLHQKLYTAAIRQMGYSYVPVSSFASETLILTHTDALEPFTATLTVACQAFACKGMTFAVFAGVAFYRPLPYRQRVSCTSRRFSELDTNLIAVLDISLVIP
ncbi:hypothetical protein EVAR_57288_1 [Eumeta japonica]|uniref:Uncharacterized protein n=1 Tax=Eumeta variegata TaxID=151549 RepID=A0A4C1YP30_EUMVA|nr:hypothetical protein EVAR_57288_1 [Eumeta japonica]